MISCTIGSMDHMDHSLCNGPCGWMLVDTWAQTLSFDREETMDSERTLWLSEVFRSSILSFIYYQQTASGKLLFKCYHHITNEQYRFEKVSLKSRINSCITNILNIIYNTIWFSILLPSLPPPPHPLCAKYNISKYITNVVVLNQAGLMLVPKLKLLFVHSIAHA